MSESETTLVHHSPKRAATAWLLVLGLLVVCLVTGSALLGMRNQKKEQAAKAASSPAPVVTVSTVRAVYRQIPEELEVTGTVSAVDPLNVGAEVNGLKVEEINVEEGDQVFKGQVLARLNSSILMAQIAQAEARLVASQAQISRAIQPNRPQDIAGLQSALSQAQAAEAQQRANLRQAQSSLLHAEQTASRYAQVLEKGFVTVQEAADREAEAERQRQLVFAAQSQLQAASWAVEQARQRLDMARVGGRSEDVSIAQSQSAEVSGLIQQLQAQVEQTYIRAPDDGMIISRDIRLGEISSSSKPFFVMARKSELELRAQVPQDDLGRVRIGDRARVVFGNQSTTGRIWRVAPQVDESNRLGTVRILLEPKKGLLSGMFARAYLKLGVEKALVVPIAAVLGEEDDRYVLVLDSELRARRRPVKTGLRTKDEVQILEGVQANDKVIATGGGFLADGDLVREGTAPAEETP